MSNPAIGWIKEHPAITASVAGAIGLLVYLMSRSGSGTSDVATVANSQLQQSQLANQNAATQAAAQVQENTAALATQASNNQTEAALAATVAQYKAQTDVATLAAGVQNTTTGAQENVAITTINAELAAQQSQVAAESKYLTEQNDLTSQTLAAALPGTTYQINKGNNASQSSAYSFLEALLNKTNASVATANGATTQQVSSNAANASIVSSLTGFFSGLFA